MGGSDPLGLTDKIFEALQPVAENYEITIVAGDGNECFEKKLAASQTDDVRILADVPCMAELMYEADLGITSGGVSMFEMAAVGTPNIVVCQTPHEVKNAELFEQRGIVLSLRMRVESVFKWIRPTFEEVAGDAAERRRMSQNGKNYVDGRGMERIITMILEKLG